MNDFYAKQIGCKLPWVREPGDKCTGMKKFAEFKNLTTRIEQGQSWQNGFMLLGQIDKKWLKV